MKALLLALVLALPISGVTAKAATPLPAGVADKALVIELTIPAPLADVWEAFTTEKGLNTWLAPSTTVSLRPGGDWLVHFGPSTGGGTIVSFVPQKELVIAALAPDKFPAVRAARTRAVFSFEARGNATVVRLTQTGWQTGPEWDAAYEYLAAGNAQLMAMLHHRFVAGPMDWSKAN
ncbi:MAG TPA: SRPBCC domain-containing protein [Acidobacteriaceae bacterium]|jgi:uncharacterized protein YndB with AHSA1/START domain|nr:SRPBCC domain-containing protein [Acidobacteriaceae bacterium]